MIQAVEPGVKTDPGPDRHLLQLPTDTYPINGWGHHPTNETYTNKTTIYSGSLHLKGSENG